MTPPLSEHESFQLQVHGWIEDEIKKADFPAMLISRIKVVTDVDREDGVRWMGIHLDLPNRHRLVGQFDRFFEPREGMAWRVQILRVHTTEFMRKRKEDLTPVGDLVQDDELRVAMETALVILESQSRDAMESMSKTLELYFPERTKHRRKVRSKDKRRKP